LFRSQDFSDGLADRILDGLAWAPVHEDFSPARGDWPGKRSLPRVRCALGRVR
jgi:hypothetical protein